MRVAALYDIHGNLPALEAVLRELGGVRPDVILVGGDVASGPMPLETLSLLRSLDDRVSFIRGNADRLLDFASRPPGAGELWERRRRWVADQLGEDHVGFLAGLPLDQVLEVDGLGRVRFCHGAPGSDEEVITSLTTAERLTGLLSGIEERVVVCGHTHVQFDRRIGPWRVVNAGSVGYPYEAEPGAYWLLAGPEVSLRRTTYNVEDALRRFRETGYPDPEGNFDELAVVDPERPRRLSELIESNV